MEKKEYFWEYQYPFATFLKNIFGENFERKYSLEGNGIFNLIKYNEKLYEVKLSEARKMAEADNKIITDKNKAEIINLICENLKNKWIVNGGKFIYFTLHDYIFKVEIIKKLKTPV